MLFDLPSRKIGAGPWVSMHMDDWINGLAPNVSDHKFAVEIGSSPMAPVIGYLTLVSENVTLQKMS
jgi:hypothetical protein